MPKTKILILAFIILFLIISGITVLAAEYTIEEGGGCVQASDCVGAVQCQTVDCLNSQCVYSDKQNGTLCDDGLVCTENDVCQTGSCSGQAVSTDDNILCTMDSCDETNGVTHTSDDSLCSEGEICDLNSGCVVSGGTGGGGGGGGGIVDSTPPSINDIKTSIENVSTSISWKTDESSLSWIVYGLTANYGYKVKTSTYKTSHSVILYGLSPGIAYHYKIKSRDRKGNIGFSDDRIFTTLEETPVKKPAAQMTIERLKAKIAEILTQIAQLRVQLTQLQREKIVPVLGIPVGFKFERNLKFGQNLKDIKYLQIFLNSDPDTRVAQRGWGSPGYETFHFGYLTGLAVIRFQEKYASEILTPWRLTKGSGFVGPTTRKKINNLLGR